MVSKTPYTGSPLRGISRLLMCSKRLVQTSFLSVVGKLLCFTLFVSVVPDIERCYYFIFRDVPPCVYHTRSLVLLALPTLFVARLDNSFHLGSLMITRTVKKKSHVFPQPIIPAGWQQKHLLPGILNECSSNNLPTASGHASGYTLYKEYPNRLTSHDAGFSNEGLCSFIGRSHCLQCHFKDGLCRTSPLRLVVRDTEGGSLRARTDQIGRCFSRYNSAG